MEPVGKARVGNEFKVEGVEKTNSGMRYNCDTGIGIKVVVVIPDAASPDKVVQFEHGVDLYRKAFVKQVLKIYKEAPAKKGHS